MNNRTPKIIISVATSRKNESELVCENEADDDHGNYQGLPHSNTYVIRSWRQAKGPENKQTNTSLEQDVLPYNIWLSFILIILWKIKGCCNKS